MDEGLKGYEMEEEKKKENGGGEVRERRLKIEGSKEDFFGVNNGGGWLVCFLLVDPSSGSQMSQQSL